MKQYVIKFSQTISDAKKQSLLALLSVVNFVSSFGIYVVEMSRDLLLSLKEDIDILYIKESV